MFDLDKWQEIFSSIKKNKLRTFLTGFAIAWGIFMLMILLGAGNGLSNGVASNFEGNAINGIWIWTNETSKPYKGFKANRPIQMDMDDYEAVKKIDGVDKVSALYWLSSGIYSYGDEYGSFSREACHPDYLDVENYKITYGRFINDIDMRYDRKVVVIGESIRKALFKDDDPVGKTIKINNLPFKVVGVYEESDPREGTMTGFLPISTAQRLFNSGDRIHNLALTTFDVSRKRSLEIEKEIRNMLAQHHVFDPEDTRPIGTYNQLDNYIETMNIFKAIKIFIWMIGIGTLIAGIVGVSNIMLIVVKERTKEFGIRKALGATPQSIVSLVILESVLITTVFGYVGMFLGISVMEGVNFILEQQAQASVGASGDLGEIKMFMNPTVDLRVAISAMLLLVAAGTFAGYIPAKRAALIKPIVALHDE